MKKRNKSKIKSVILEHIVNNKKEYIIMILLFIIGILLGILVVNNTQEDQYNNVENYINTFIEKIKNSQEINTMNLLKNSIIKNITCAIGIWFFGTTVIRNTCCLWNCFI